MAVPSEHAASVEVGERELPVAVPLDGPRLLAPVEGARPLAGEVPRAEAAPPPRELASRRRALRRRMRGLGSDALDTRELLELLGTPAEAWDGDLAALARSEPRELAARLGARSSVGWRVAAALALARRLAQDRGLERPAIRGPADVQGVLGPLLRGELRESFHVLLLDGKHRLRGHHVVSIGSLSTSIVHPREVFRPAVRAGAAAILCAHNHPSGDPEPSQEDLAVTQRLEQSGKLLGIPLLDHIVLGEGRWISLRERMGF
ncbi:MAG: DNA repair protein RadC [Planctomycetota bacterium]|nr:DNA repair protein RadC [Planctomycetota bacterium]